MSTTRQAKGFADVPEVSGDDTDLVWRVVINSPGTVDMGALTSLANALKRPVAHLAKMVYHAPTVLLHGIAADQAAEIADGCRQLGLAAVAEVGDGEIESGPDRFDVAVHVEDPGALPDAIDTVSRVVGVPADQAYRMLATPPGLLIGGISEASAEALDQRFGPGVELRVCRTDTGPFDLNVAPDAPVTAELEQLCGPRRGLVIVGLDHDQAEHAATRLPKGSVQVVARDLVRFDLVFEGLATDGQTDSEEAPAWVSANFGVGPDRFDAIVRHAPIALDEGLPFDRAEKLSTEGRAAGLRLTVAAAGFDRYGVTVVKAADLAAVGELAREMELPVPARLPALLADGLSDLEARCLAHCFEQVGALLSFHGSAEGSSAEPLDGRFETSSGGRP